MTAVTLAGSFTVKQAFRLRLTGELKDTAPPNLIGSFSVMLIIILVMTVNEGLYP